MKIKKLASVVITLGLAAAMAVTAPAEDQKVKVGLAFGGLDAVPTVVMNFLTAKMDDLGWEYVVTNGDLDVNKYLADLESLCQQDLDVIMTRVPNDSVNPSALDITVPAEQPLFFLATATEVEQYKDSPYYLGHVSDPELVRGTPLCDWLINYIDENEGFVPKIGIICGAKAIDSRGICERTTDIVDGLDAAGKEYEIVADVEANPNWMASGAMQITEDWLQAYTTDQLNTILCWSDEMCVGVIQALQAAGKSPDDYLVLSYDGLEIIWDYVKEGWIDCSSALLLEQQADAVIDYIKKYMSGEYDKEKDFQTYCNSVYVLDQSNVESVAAGEAPEFYDYTPLLD